CCICHRRKSARGELQSGTVKMLQHGSMRNLKFSCLTAVIRSCIGTRSNGLRTWILGTPRREARPGSGLTRTACPPSEKDVDQQQNRQSQTECEMNPTRPFAQFFAARVIKAVAGDG